MHDAAVSVLTAQLADAHLDPDQLNTQEKAWLLMAAHALAKRGTARSLALNGDPAETLRIGGQGLERRRERRDGGLPPRGHACPGRDC